MREVRRGPWVAPENVFQNAGLSEPSRRQGIHESGPLGLAVLF
jgi:hypothetical protein